MRKKSSRAADAVPGKKTGASKVLSVAAAAHKVKAVSKTVKKHRKRLAHLKKAVDVIGRML